MTIVLSEEPMTVHHLHRATVAHCPPCHGQCRQGRACNASDNEACAEEGGKHHDPAPTKTRPGLGLLIVALGWPVVLVIGCAVVVIVLNMPRISG